MLDKISDANKRSKFPHLFARSVGKPRKYLLFSRELGLSRTCAREQEGKYHLENRRTCAVGCGSECFGYPVLGDLSPVSSTFLLFVGTLVQPDSSLSVFSYRFELTLEYFVHES